MKLSFITYPIIEGVASVGIAKCLKDHDPVIVLFTWSRFNRTWAFEGFFVECQATGAVKMAANLLHHIDRFLTEAQITSKVCTPELLMKKLEDAGCKQVVISGGAQVDVADVEGIKDQWHPEGFPDILVNAVDDADAASSIKGRMLRIMKEDESKEAALAIWFANGRKIVKIDAADRPVFVHQSEYHIKGS